MFTRNPASKDVVKTRSFYVDLGVIVRARTDGGLQIALGEFRRRLHNVFVSVGM